MQESFTKRYNFAQGAATLFMTHPVFKLNIYRNLKGQKGKDRILEMT